MATPLTPAPTPVINNMSASSGTERAIGSAAHPKADAAVRFAKVLIEKRGHISDSDFSQLQQAGLSEAEIGEIVAVLRRTSPGASDVKVYS